MIKNQFILWLMLMNRACFSRITNLQGKFLNINRGKMYHTNLRCNKKYKYFVKFYKKQIFGEAENFSLKI